MFKKILIIASLLLSFASMAQSIESKRNQLLKILDEELAEVSRLNKRTKGKNPNLVLRIAEILLEKARHLKERENGEFLSLPPEKRNKINKKAFFKGSTSYFIQAQKTCFYILKRYRKFKGRGDVYYILAYNAKEFQQDKKAREFFKKAIKYSPPNSKTRIRSATALAEILYNEGSFKKAIPLYERSLKQRNDMWWTKDAHNLAWCYFKAGKKSKAISLMRDIHEKSKSPKYVDMSYNVERDIAYFYADTKRIKDAIAFFKEQGKSVSDNLLKVSKYLINQGKFTSAETTLNVAKGYDLSPEEQIEVNLALLNLFERFGKVNKHLQVANELVALHKSKGLKDSDLKDLIYHVEKMAANLQKQAVSKTYSRQPKIRRAKAAAAVGYYEILASLRSKDAHKSYYYGAEALYASKQYNDAIDMYSKAQDASMAKKDAKFIKLSNTALLVALGQKGVKKANVDKFLIPSYIGFLQRDSKSKEAHKIYQRLFNAYFTKGDLVNSEKTLLSFKKNFPQDKKIQEAMLAKIMDYYRGKKDRAKIAEYVNRIKAGEFSVSKKYAKRLQYILLTMQFENVEKANTRGDKIRALQGYVAIYKSNESTADAKKNAAYNIAVLFHEVGDAKRSYLWMERAFTHMDGKDVVKFSSSVLAMANAMLNSGYFQYSAQTSVKALEKICKRRSKNKDIFFKNSILIYLADNKHEKAESVMSGFRSCGISTSTIKDMQLNFVKYYEEKSMWLSYEKKLQELESSRSYWPELVNPTFLLAKNYDKAARANLAKAAEKKAFKFYRYAVRNNKPVALEALNEVAKIEIAKLDNEIQSFNNYRLTFPENRFRSMLQNKLKKLDRVTTKAISVLKIGSGLGISLAYRKLVQVYEGMAKELQTFKLPADKGPEYQKAFKKNMDALAGPLLKKAMEFNREAKQKISSQMILTPYNNYFFSSRKDIDFFFFPTNNGVLMDRGGQR